eukprot:3566930-Amphidinium_carterae.4
MSRYRVQVDGRPNENRQMLAATGNRVKSLVREAQSAMLMHGIEVYSEAHEYRESLLVSSGMTSTRRRAEVFPGTDLGEWVDAYCIQGILLEAHKAKAADDKKR